MSDTEQEMEQEESASEESEVTVKQSHKRSNSNSEHASKRNSGQTQDEILVKDIKAGLSTGLYDCVAILDGKSAVWKSYMRVVTSDTAESMDYVCCMGCNLVYRFGKTSGTTALSRHAMKCKSSKAGLFNNHTLDDYIKPKLSMESKNIISTALAQ